jgi:ribonuclease T2
MRRALALALLLLAAPAAAEVPVEGTFAAERDCPAPLSIRTGANPGEARVAPGDRHPLLAENRADGDWWLIRLEGAEPERRWVAKTCGRREAPGEAVAPTPAAPPRPAADPAARENVLAASWLPAFCEGAAGRPECRALDAAPASRPARAFSLHGLWPQPRGLAYCDEAEGLEDRRWSDLPFPGVDRETAERLVVAMPGVASRLHRHQWAKHGSCYRAAGGADEYFDDALWLLAELNASPLRALFEDNAGRVLAPAEIRRAADAAFGPGAGERITTVCADGMILELRLHLSGPVTPGESDLGALLRAAPPAPPGCGGRVDRP